MAFGAWKKVFDALPQGVVVFDNQYRVKFVNASFLRAFSATPSKVKNFSSLLACGETGKCGSGENCAYCAFFGVIKRAVEENTEQDETLTETVSLAGRTDKISMRVRVLPVDNKGKLFVGFTDGAYESQMERELLSAKRMQQRLLPAGKSVGGVSYSYMYIPKYSVGGDMPDVYELNAQTYGVLSDVSGKGISAGMLSAFVKAGLDRKQPDLAKALMSLNSKFNELNQDERSYVTVVAVRIDEQTGTMRYVSAGHNVPILLKNSYGIHEIESPAPPISTWMPDFVYEEKELPFQKGDLLVMLTDGVTECVNAKGEQFGVERVETVLMQSHGAEDFVGKLKATLGVFSGGNFTDDITAIAFEL